MGHRTSTEGHRVLVAAPYGRDAESVVELLRRHGYDAQACADLDAAAAAIDEHVGVIILTEEALRYPTEALRRVIAAQPAWSDIPFILLAASQRGGRNGAERVRARIAEFTGNAIVLERPLSLASLLSAATSAMRARQKQFEMRNRISDLADSEARLRLATSAAAIGTWEYDPVNGTLIYDARTRAIFGLSADEPITYAEDFAGRLHPDDRDQALAAVERSVAPGSDGSYAIEYRVIGADDGVERLVSARGGVAREGGRVRFAGTVIDVTARREAEDALRGSEALARQNIQRVQLALAAGAIIGTWFWDLPNDRFTVDEAFATAFGLDPAIGRHGLSLSQVVETVHPEDQAGLGRAINEAIARGGAYAHQYRVRRTDGHYYWIEANGHVEHAADGTPLSFPGVLLDIDRRRAIEGERDRALRDLRMLNDTLEQRVAERSAELMRAEAQLRQSQKMEAVGQLTGGIAHDFNNMLTGVIGALDIMKRRIASGRTDDLDRFMDAATVSSQRAAALTARLLAFSRRQSLDLRPVDANGLMHSLEELLRRTIRENVALRIITDPGIPPAVADANQLENAILNLAINARDAMPDGGQLTIETKAVELDSAYVAARGDIAPGHYVVIAVTDTGVGMTPEILEKVFDPFFTTKPIGQGTGLGLSMVYGFAHQSGGQVRVHSQPGVGTTVSVYLKAGEPIASAEPHPDRREVPEGNGQTVLLVEDDPSVRLLVREVLEELSYTAIEAAAADAAIPILQSDRPIDLLVSDVGLPGMNGRQLAEIARQHRPDLPVLFVTGYAENAAIRAGFLGTNMAMITKPFALDELASKISGMIDRR